MGQWMTGLILIAAISSTKISAQQNRPASGEIGSTNKNTELNTAFLTAVRNGDVDMIIECIKRGSLDDYFSRITQEDKVKLKAIMYNKFQVLKTLLSNSIVFVPSQEHLKDSDDQELFNVTYVPQTELSTKLMVNMTSVLDPFLYSLHKMCLMPEINLRVINYILDRGVDINARDLDNSTVLFSAVNGGSLPLVELLVDRGATVNATIRAPVNVWYQGRYGRYMKLFSKNVVLPAAAVISVSPLFYALVHQHTDIVLYLLSKGADVRMDRAGWVPPLIAMITGNVEIAKGLIENGLDIDTKDLLGSIPLHNAVAYNRLEIAKLLLRKGSKVNITDVYGWTPLHTAAFLASDQSELFVLLLNTEKRLVHSVTDGGFSPLNLAEAGQNHDLLQYLVKSLSMNCTDDYSLLEGKHSDDEHSRVIRLLVEGGSDVDHQDDILGWSTLHWAAASGDLRVVKELVEKYGAKVDIISRKGETPLDLAKHFGMLQVSKYLQSLKKILSKR